MDIKHILDQMLQAGKTMAEQKLGIPASGSERDQTLSGLKTGALAAGVIGILLGTQGGRRVTGAAIKVGSLAALGGLAYQMYRQWQAGASSSHEATATTQAEPPALEAPAPKASPEVLLKAMVAAAKADGHVDAAEMENIRTQLAEANLGADLNDLIMEELTQPRTANDIAALTQGDGNIAAEIYLVSAAIIDTANEAEKAYLEDLRQALGLPEAATNLQS